MNINDRKRISSLIESEFRARREAATRGLTPEEITKEADAILSKNKLKDKVSKLSQARALVEQLEKELSIAIAVFRKSPATKRRRGYDGCECHENYGELLQEVAVSNLLDARGGAKVVEKLLAEERKLLTRVEIAKTVDDLEKIVKAAGLL